MKALFALFVLACSHSSHWQRADWSFLHQPAPVLVQPNVSFEWACMVENVKFFEGYFPEPYRCPAGVVTVGYGHTAQTDLQAPLTRSEAHSLLMDDLEAAREHVRRIVKVPLNEGQEAALTSFTFNCGQGNLARLVNGPDRLNAGNYDSIKQILPLYRKGGGRILKGLVKRRKFELTLWNSDDTLLANQ